MLAQTIKTHQDFELLSDEKPWIGGVIFVNNEKYIITRILDHRVYHNAGEGEIEGFNPDLTQEQGWMRYFVMAEKAD